MNTGYHDSAAAAERRSACCSFCRKDPGDAGTLIEGPNIDGFRAYICRDCVELCAMIFEQKSASQNEATSSQLDPTVLAQKIEEFLQLLSDPEREALNLHL